MGTTDKPRLTFEVDVSGMSVEQAQTALAQAMAGYRESPAGIGHRLHEVQVHFYEDPKGWTPLEDPSGAPIRGSREWCEGYVAGAIRHHDGAGYFADEDGIRCRTVDIAVLADEATGRKP